MDELILQLDYSYGQFSWQEKGGPKEIREFILNNPQYRLEELKLVSPIETHLLGSESLERIFRKRIAS